MYFLDTCQDLAPLINLIKHGLIPIFQIGIPILLIVFGMLDLGKAVIASEEKEVKAAQKRLIQRFIYAALVFFVPTLVYFVMNMVASGETDADTTSWKGCWNAAK